MVLISNGVETENDTRKSYVKPEIVHEIELETRAGSLATPQGFLDPFQTPEP